MARYAIWDGASHVYTPVGERLTAEQWAARYPWVNVPGVKMIVGGGVINGSVAMELEATLAHYARLGCDFTGCETDGDKLAAIEAFEDAPAPEAVTDQTRIADALEDLVVLNMPDAV